MSEQKLYNEIYITVTVLHLSSKQEKNISFIQQQLFYFISNLLGENDEECVYTTVAIQPKFFEYYDFVVY